MSSHFRQSLKIVTIAHVAVVAIIVVVSGCRGLFGRKKETMVPIEFVVQAAAPGVSEPEPEPIPEPAPDPPEPVPAPEPEPAPAPKPPKREIERGRRIRRKSSQPPRKTLSDEEIRRLLAEGARLSDHTSIPDEDERGFALLRRALHAAWAQPPGAAVGTGARVKVRIDGSGRVTGGEIVQASGDPSIDSSALQAVNSVGRIRGLTPGFLERHKVVTVAFKIE